jgi:hypothetical protein
MAANRIPGIFGYYVSSYLDFWGLQHVAAALSAVLFRRQPGAAIGVLVYRKPVLDANANRAVATALWYLSGTCA